MELSTEDDDTPMIKVWDYDRNVQGTRWQPLWDVPGEEEPLRRTKKAAPWEGQSPHTVWIRERNVLGRGLVTESGQVSQDAYAAAKAKGVVMGAITRQLVLPISQKYRDYDERREALREQLREEGDTLDGRGPSVTVLEARLKKLRAPSGKQEKEDARWRSETTTRRAELQRKTKWEHPPTRRTRWESPPPKPKAKREMQAPQKRTLSEHERDHMTEFEVAQWLIEQQQHIPHRQVRVGGPPQGNNTARRCLIVVLTALTVVLAGALWTIYEIRRNGIDIHLRVNTTTE